MGEDYFTLHATVEWLFLGCGAAPFVGSLFDDDFLLCVGRVLDLFVLDFLSLEDAAVAAIVAFLRLFDVFVLCHKSVKFAHSIFNTNC